jgi:transcriptional regulator with XRE-family HTH domain
MPGVVNPEDRSLLRSLGTRIKLARRGKGWTQTELASRVGVKQGLLSRIERGEVNTSIVNLRKIKIALEVGWQELFPISESRVQILNSSG